MQQAKRAPVELTLTVDLKNYALSHQCARHALFEQLNLATLSLHQVANLLRNYDAHAALLRRLLLKAATLMPEPAVGFILENVRNEYGNGSYDDAHQFQLLDLAIQAGVSREEFSGAKITSGVRRFIGQAPKFYGGLKAPTGMMRAAIAAGAITATELLAVLEFSALQRAFRQFGLADHVWFDHVKVEAEHSMDSLELAEYFSTSPSGCRAVMYGLEGMLTNNIDLYDGLLESLSN